MTRRTVAALAGAATLPVGAVARAQNAPASQMQKAQKAARPAGKNTKNEYPTPSCFAKSLCAIQNRVRFRNPAWTQEYCQIVAGGILDAAQKTDLPPMLVLAIMLNESDMNEKAFAATMRDGKIYAMDSGLMGIRCVVGQRGRCTNGRVRGLSWTSVMDPLTNIRLGAEELARWRDGGAVTSKTIRVSGENGQFVTKVKTVPCPHKTHAYWAHYNHGPRYIDRGSARHYPHRIAVLQYALGKAMGVNVKELLPENLTVQDPGMKVRTADRPVEARYKKLCDQIRAIGDVCTGVAALTATSPRPN